MICHFSIVDGMWGDWSQYTPCSTTCGNGTRRRSRRCDDPQPQYKGIDCEGAPFEQINCTNSLPCAGMSVL